MKRRVFALLVVTSITAMFSGIGQADPSDGCSAGAVPPSTTPAGIGLNAGADPATGLDVTACNTGAVVPSPAKGAARVRIDPAGSGHAEIDGDADNTATACTDGFLRVAGDADGPHFFESKDGSYSDTNPSQSGDQQAEEEAPDAWAQNIAANCSA